jgi:flagellar basal-body rod protein FlgG
MSQGDLKNTSNPYDVAIQGPGFFRVQQPDGTDAFTRAGDFGLSPEGQLVTDQGYTVAPGLSIPTTALAVAINAQGQVSATLPGQAAPQVVGTLELTRFANEGGLKAVGNNLFLETPSSGAPQSGVPGSAGYGTIQQGFLETSNVNAVEEITSLITAQRAYEMNSKVVTAADDMLQMTARLGGA